MLSVTEIINEIIKCDIFRFMIFILQMVNYCVFFQIILSNGVQC